MLHGEIPTKIIDTNPLQIYSNLENLRMEFIFEWNHLKEVGIGNLWFSVLLVNDCEPHNDGHYSDQEYENNYKHAGKSNMAANFSWGNRNNGSGDNRIQQHKIP